MTNYSKNKITMEAWKAAQMDNLEELKKLVPSCVSPDDSIAICNPDSHDHTLLMTAAAHGAILCTQYLINNNANVNAKNFAGYTALHWAAYCGREEVISKLRGNNALDVESRTEDGKTPLHIAALRGNNGVIIELLDKFDADINAISSNGYSAMNYAIMANQRATAELLFQRKIDTEMLDAQKRTIQEFASLYKRRWFPELEEKYMKKDD